MSRSNNTEMVNPAEKFLKWSGSDGTLSYFDKTAGEKGENVNVPLPFQFLVLDKLAQVTGGLDDNNGYIGYWSNAVRNTKTQKFTVRSKRGVETQGFYEQVKAYPGVKYMTLLYVAYKDVDGLKIAGLKLSGAALNAWIEFSKNYRNIYAGAFSIVGSVRKKKGSNSYFEPEFAFNPQVSDATDEAAKELDVHLQEYLNAYFAQQGIAEAEAEYSPDYSGVPDNRGDAWEPDEEPTAARRAYAMADEVF